MRTRKTAIVLGIAAVAALTITMMVSHTIQSTASEQCPLDTFLALPQHQQQACIEAMGGKPGLHATIAAIERATELALPPSTQTAGPPALIATPWPTGYVPEVYQKIGPIDTSGQSPFSPHQSVWHVGAVLSERGYSSPLIIAAGEFVCSISSIVFDQGDWGFEVFPGAKVGYQWDCPENIGPLTITGATGPTGIISFTDTLSRTITFDLTREAWRLEGQPWVAPAPPSAGSIPAAWEVIEPHRPPPNGTDLKIPKRTYERSLGAWWIGATLTSEGLPRRIVAVSYENYGCSLETIPFGFDAHGFLQFLAREDQRWKCPMEGGALTIIGATGPTGIITFTNELSQTGTFDLATEEWTLAGAPWLPAATPTPAP